MSLAIFYREAQSAEPNTFVARVDGPVILITAHVRRTDASSSLTLTLPCWVDARGRQLPPYDRPLFALYRQSESTWRLPGVTFGPGDRPELWLLDVPEVVGSDWYRAGA